MTAIDFEIIAAVVTISAGVALIATVLTAIGMYLK